jgi:asparagine synthase (glutamine-hydrolysing)
MKVRGRGLRYAQRRLAERYLPREVLDRPKQGFSSPLPYLLRDEYSVLRNLFLRNSHLAQDEIWNQSAIDRLMGQNEAGKQDHGNRLWLLLNAEIWYRLRIQGVSRSDLQEQIQEAQTRPADP